MALNIFKETPDKAVSELDDDALDVRPEVPGVSLALSLSRLGKRLAGVSCQQSIDLPAPWTCMELFKIVPDRGRVQISGPLARDERASGVFLDLDVAGGGKARLGKPKTHVKSAAACAEGEAVSGRKHQPIGHIAPLAESEALIAPVVSVACDTC
nr:hypothetical protein [uncultured Roseibium sp.]